MKRYLLTKSSYENNEYILIFHPDVSSVNSLLGKIDFSQVPDDSIVRCDLIIFVGDRLDRFIEFKISNGKINLKSVIKGNQNKEVVSETEKFYSRLPIGFIDKIYPINYRNIIIKLKEEATEASS